MPTSDNLDEVDKGFEKCSPTKQTQEETDNLTMCQANRLTK